MQCSLKYAVYTYILHLLYLAGGDSAGGNLAVAALASLRDSSPTQLTKKPIAAILVSPAMDLSDTACFHDEEWTSQHDPQYDYLPHKVLATGAHVYVRDQSLLTDPRVSPIYMSDFKGLTDSKWAVVAGGAELFYRDITRFVDKLAKDVDVEYIVEKHEPHAWGVIGLPHLMKKQQVVLDFIIRQLNASEVPNGESGKVQSHL